MQLQDIWTKRLLTAPVLFLAYWIVSLAVFFTSKSIPDIPSNQDGMDVDQAWVDLHTVSYQPHPYNSHQNDAVRGFILSRLRSIAAGHPHVHIVDDLTTNVTYVDPPAAAYFEGKNILVKVDGTDSVYQTEGGVLFSAHLDSVASASGATDDGMATVTLLQLVQYLANNRPARTAVFNINDGEEDGLNGAHAFLNHEWSTIPDSFLNLEGSGAGGRPIFFRTTSLAPILSALAQYVPNPHANVISSDGFKRNLIRSRTDFSVYADAGNLQGVDLAFYKHRSFYHTKYDAIPFISGQKKSLWAMMESARGAGWALLNQDELHEQKWRVPPVFFDLFASELVAFSQTRLFVINVVILILFPVILLGLAMYQQPAIRGLEEGTDLQAFKRASRELWSSIKSDVLWTSFWTSLIVTVALEVVLVLIYVQLNPFIVYSSPYVVLFTLFVFALLSTKLSIKAFGGFTNAVALQQQEFILLKQLYLFTWLLTLIGTIFLVKFELGTVYFLTAWNIFVFLALIIHDTAPTTLDVNATEERQPLLSVDQDVSNGTDAPPSIRGSQEKVSLRWFLEILFVVVPQAILVLHLLAILLDGVTQTLADGGNPITVYLGIAFFSIFLALPVAPWSQSIHRVAVLYLSVVFLVATIYALITFPFSTENPLKLFFQQTVELGHHWQVSTSGNPSFIPNFTASSQVVIQSRGDTPTVRSTLVGTPYYLEKEVIPSILSASGKQVECAETPDRSGTITCKWDTSDLMPSPDSQLPAASTGHLRTKWIDADIKRTGPISAQFSILGTNSRNCRIYFDSRPLVAYHVHDASDAVTPTPGYEMPEGGVHELRLFARDWGKTFIVDVEWKRQSEYQATLDDPLEGRIACEWNEYASARMGTDQEDKPGSLIPAFEEMLLFAPKWVSVSKLYHGLLEVSGNFSIA